MKPAAIPDAKRSVVERVNNLSTFLDSRSRTSRDERSASSNLLLFPELIDVITAPYDLQIQSVVLRCGEAKKKIGTIIEYV